MTHSFHQCINLSKKHALKYTIISGIDAFDGTRKEAEKQVVKSIE